MRGKQALVTGGSSGIGRAIAAALAGAGARVAITGRDSTKLDAVAGEIGALPIVAELATPESAATLATRSMEILGGLDILVLCSGTYLSGRVTEMPDGALAELLAANLIGPASLAKCLIPALANANGDLLVVNSSITRAQNTSGRAYFAASQHAMKAFTDGLRDEVNDIGIRVTSIFPGTTATPRQERLHGQAGRDYQPERLLQAADVAAVALAALSLRHTAEMTDVYVRPRYKSVESFTARADK